MCVALLPVMQCAQHSPAIASSSHLVILSRSKIRKSDYACMSITARSDTRCPEIAPHVAAGRRHEPNTSKEIMPLVPSPQQQHGPLGPRNDLHDVARTGSVELTLAVLATGSFDIDQGTPRGLTPLMIAAANGFAHIAGILLDNGASASIADGNGFTALHYSSMAGRLAVTKMLLEAGANPDSRKSEGETPLYIAASKGHVEIARVLLRAQADATLPITTDEQHTFVPLDAAAQNGHSGVVRELVQQRAIEVCVGPRGGLVALALAARQQHVHVMSLLTAAGVIDTQEVLFDVIEHGREASVKFLLQQQRRNPAGVSGYVNMGSNDGTTPLLSSVSFAGCNPRIVRLLIDAGADASLAVEVRDTTGGLDFKGTPLARTTDSLLHKNVEGKEATEEQLNRLKAIRRLLMRVEAVHAVSWLWPSNPPRVTQTAESSTRITSGSTPSTPLTSMLPILRRRASRHRRVVMPAVFRYTREP